MYSIEGNRGFLFVKISKKQGFSYKQKSHPESAEWLWGSQMVGTTGFEPTTSSTPRKRATKLRYVPNISYVTTFPACCKGIFTLAILLQAHQHKAKI